MLYLVGIQRILPPRTAILRSALTLARALAALAAVGLAGRSGRQTHDTEGGIVRAGLVLGREPVVEGVDRVTDGAQVGVRLGAVADELVRVGIDEHELGEGVSLLGHRRAADLQLGESLLVLATRPGLGGDDGVVDGIELLGGAVLVEGTREHLGGVGLIGDEVGPPRALGEAATGVVEVTTTLAGGHLREQGLDAGEHLLEGGDVDIGDAGLRPLEDAAPVAVLHVIPQFVVEHIGDAGFELHDGGGGRVDGEHCGHE